MKKIYLLLVVLLTTTLSFGQDLLISGIFDGPLSGGTPKGVELYVVNNIADLSLYGIGSANNGGGSDGEEFTFPADSYTAGDFIYVATESTQFTNWFGFAPNYTDGSMAINGDDAVELFYNGSVIDVYGDINTDGTGEAWEYKDGWAYRNNDTGPDGSTFVLANWTFSGPDALDGETDNATAATPFPVGTYMITSGIIGEAPVISCPADATADSEPGVCGAAVYFADASAIDTEDGPLATTQTAGPASGDIFPIGDTVVTFSVTDSDGNTVTCNFTVTVTDVEAPVALCQDVTVELDAAGMASITPADVDAGSGDSCGFTLSLSQSSFSCADVGDNTVTLTVTDDSGLTATCDATVTVEDNQAPVVVCKGSGGSGSILEEFEATTIPNGWSTEILSGSWDWTFGSGVMPGGDAFPSNAAIFDDDAAGSGTANAARLYSPSYSIAGADSATLSFDYSLQDFAGAGEFTVEVWDGAAWQEILFLEADTPPTNFPAMDMLPFANANFQVRFTYDDEDGGWNWGAGIDNFAFDYNIPPTPPLEVVLDADGTVTVPGADLLYSVDDNCGYSVGATAICDSSNPSNAFENGRGCNATNGWTAANDLIVVAGENFMLNQISANIFLEVGSSITSVDVFYYEDNAGVPGTQIGSQAGVVPTSQNVLGNNFGFDIAEVIMDVTPFEFDSQPSSDTTYWIGITTTNDATGDLRNFWEVSTASAVGNGLAFTDGTGYSIPAAAEDGVYTFSGMCGSSNYTFDCSNLGENSVDVTVTDAGGNEVTCTATVIVTDETAPVVVCGSLLYDSLSESDSPALAIPDSDPVGVTTTITVADDFTISDVNVPIDITHTWIGDLIVSVTSPAGTEVVLHAQSGGSDDDIVVTYDDEGTAPANPLAAFDGESSMGTWTLFVSDNAGGDTGTVNSWGLEIEYSYPNPDPIVTLELDENGEFTVTPEDVTTTLEDACGLDVVLLDLDGYTDTTLTCADIGLDIQATIFVNDASGNFASCQTTINVVDAMAPELTCPDVATYGIEPSNNDGVYVVRDYFGIGAATTSDNCTDNANLVITQDPAPGTEWGINGSGNPGPYVVTFTVEDESGNVATCTLEVTVTNGIGVSENTLLDNALNMYPNPATDLVKLVNTSDIALESAMIYDINGKLVTELDLNDMGTETTFDISGFANGVYMVKIIGENASAVKRLIKE